MEKEKKETEVILEAWYSLSKDYRPERLTEEERAKFDQVRFAEDQSRKSEFALGGRINLNL